MCQTTTSTDTHIVPAIQQFQLIIIIKRRWKCPQYEFAQLFISSDDAGTLIQIAARRV